MAFLYMKTLNIKQKKFEFFLHMLLKLEIIFYVIDLSNLLLIESVAFELTAETLNVRINTEG